MDISTDYISSIADSALSESTAAKAKSLANANTEEDDKKLMEACKSFEQYFIEQIFKQGFDTVLRADDDMSASSKSLRGFYEDTLFKEVAACATQREDGLGLAKMMYEQMKREDARVKLGDDT